METFSALLAICAGNSPVPGEFPQCCHNVDMSCRPPRQNDKRKKYMILHECDLIHKE